MFLSRIISNLISSNANKKVKCPNCDSVLAKTPGSKTKCKFCGQFMYVRTDPKNFKKVIVSRSRAEDIDMKWNRINNPGEPARINKIYELNWKRGEKSIVNRFIGVDGITELDIFERRQERYNIYDALWSLFQERLLINQAEHNYDAIIGIYLSLEQIRLLQNKTANYIA